MSEVVIKCIWPFLDPAALRRLLKVIPNRASNFGNNQYCFLGSDERRFTGVKWRCLAFHCEAMLALFVIACRFGGRIIKRQYNVIGIVPL